MKKSLIFLFIFLILSGCIYQASISSQVLKPSCKVYCKQQPHIQCLGEWEISGEYPDCKCEFNCEQSASGDAEKDKELIETESKLPEEPPVEEDSLVEDDALKTNGEKETDDKEEIDDPATDLTNEGEISATETGLPDEIIFIWDKSADETVKASVEKDKLSALQKELLSWKKEGKRLPFGISSCTLKADEKYWMYYSSNGIELAFSDDGLNFEQKGSVFQSPDFDFMITNPAVIELENGFRMFYEGKNLKESVQHRKLYSAFSEDGLKWEDEGLRYEDFGDGKPGEIFVSVPDVIKIDEELFLYYTRGVTLAVAVSEDNGLSWKKVKDIIFLGVSVGMDPDVIKVDNGFKLFFTTAESPDLQKAKFTILSASSLDGLNFVLDEGVRLEPADGKKIVSDVDVISLGNEKYRMYYSQASDFSFMDAEIHSAFSENE